MHFNGAHRSCQNGKLKLHSEQIKCGVRFKISVYRIHVDTDLLPRLIVNDRPITNALCSGTRDMITACLSVTFDTCHTMGLHGRSCVIKYLLICHNCIPRSLESHTIKSTISYVPADSFRLSHTYSKAHCHIHLRQKTELHY